jgi:hypothetical protein
MIETPLPSELYATTPAPDPAPRLEQLATPRRENAALRRQNAAFQERIRELEGPVVSVQAPSNGQLGNGW